MSISENVLEEAYENTEPLGGEVEASVHPSRQDQESIFNLEYS